MMPPKATPKFTKEDKWFEISRRFCRFHGLPNGSALKVIYNISPRFPKGRVQRDNTIYRRAVFKKAVLDRVDDGENIRQLIDAHLLPYVEIDLKTMGAKILAFGPDGQALDSRTLVGTWRDLSPLPTEEEIEGFNEREEQIEMAAKEARPYLNNLSEFHWAPENNVPQGVIRALVTMFGSAVVRNAVQAELER